MGHGTLLISMLRDFEKRARERPCTRSGLEGLEREFEERLKELRERDDGSFCAERLQAGFAELLRTVDAVRLALRQGLVAHDKARVEILRLQQLIARGHNCKRQHQSCGCGPDNYRSAPAASHKGILVNAYLV